MSKTVWIRANICISCYTWQISINSEQIKSVVGKRGNTNQIICACHGDIALGVQKGPSGM